MPLIQSTVASASEVAAARAHYEAQGFTATEHTATRAVLTKADVVVEISIRGQDVRRRGGGRALVAALAVLLVAGSLAYGGLAVLGLAPGDCTVAGTGTASNVEVSGIGAESACSKAQQSNSLALFRSQPSGDVVCQYSQHFTTITVRDQGIFKIAGNAYCVALRQDFGAVPAPGASP